MGVSTPSCRTAWLSPTHCCGVVTAGISRSASWARLLVTAWARSLLLNGNVPTVTVMPTPCRAPLSVLMATSVAAKPLAEISATFFALMKSRA
jgi:hypothetical protein